jgi:DNA-binding MarR family transcriptional regulator
VPSEYDPQAVSKAEQDIRARLANKPVDLEVQRAISNIYRAATVVSRTAEREVLTKANLSWSAFIVLWVLWVWREMDPSQLAAEIGLTMGTLTGVRKGLETQGLIATTRDPDDGRRLQVALTAKGDAKMQELYPHFNGWATGMTRGLDESQVIELSQLLETIIVQPE